MSAAAEFAAPAHMAIPPGLKPVKERNATILMPEGNTTFLNPIQEYNRDLSVAVIKQFMADSTVASKAKFEATAAKRNRKKANKSVQAEEKDEVQAGAPAVETPFKAQKYTIIEALSATGLRSIRYAQELPEAGLVIANDFSKDAVEAMRQNVRYNGVEAVPRPPAPGKAAQNAEASTSAAPTGSSAPAPALAYSKEDMFVAKGTKRKTYLKKGVEVNEGDAIDLLYAHRGDHARVDVVDLDPYGTAAPFVDGAVQAVTDGGLLCVTCTDLSVLAGGNYPEKCYSNYGGMPVKAEYSHEGALRLVLHSLASSAARYGRHITPLLSLSIDFYVRVFVRVNHSPQGTKHTASRTGTVYICTYCQAHSEQRFGRAIERETKGEKQYDFKTHSGPPTSKGGCEHCGNAQLLAGPMWLGPLHDPEFVGRVQESVERDKEMYGTAARMKGMLTLAKEELTDAPFYFTPAKVSSFFHAQCVRFDQYASALMNAGYKASRSHASAGSIKTDAPTSLIHDVIREFIKTSPVRRDKINDGSPAHKLLDKPMSHEISFTAHADAAKLTLRKELVRYQMNPTENWGPASKAKPAPKTGTSGASAPAASAPVPKEEEPDAGILPAPGSESLADMGLQPPDELSQEVDKNGIETSELAGAERAVEVVSGSKRASEESAEPEQPAKRRRAAEEDDEEAAMNGM